MEHPMSQQVFEDAGLQKAWSEKCAQSKDRVLLVPQALTNTAGTGAPCFGSLSAPGGLRHPVNTVAKSVSGCHAQKNPEARFWGYEKGKPFRIPHLLFALVIFLSTGLSLTSLIYSMHLHGLLESEAASRKNLMTQVDTMETALKKLVGGLKDRDHDTSSAELLPVDLLLGGQERKASSLSSQRGTRGKRSYDCDGDCWTEIREVCQSEVAEYLIQRIDRVHLEAANERPGDDGKFLWRIVRGGPTSFSPRGVKLKLNGSELINGIEIEKTGVYVVYSQVVLQGQTGNASRDDCAQETVVILPNRTRIVLMMSYVTQRGHADRRSVDTSMQIGTFGLLRQSVVYVQHPDHRGECRHTNFKTDNRLASFFGLYRIA